MTSPVLYEPFYTAAFLVREANGYLSRDPGTITNATGADIQYSGGLVVSLAAGGAATAVAGANTGNGTIGAIATTGATPSGVYLAKVTKTDGTFELLDPKGDVAGLGATGAAFAGGEGIGFTITAGATAFALGDTFIITVGVNPGAYVPYSGASTAAGILFNRTWVSAGTTRKVTVITRLAEVNASEVQWDASVTGAANPAAVQALATSQLNLLGIVFR